MQGFFYNRYKPPSSNEKLGTETDTNIDQQLWYHVVGRHRRRTSLSMQNLNTLLGSLGLRLRMMEGKATSTAHCNVHAGARSTCPLVLHES